MGESQQFPHREVQRHTALFILWMECIQHSISGCTKWLNDGIQDALFPMMYFQGNHFYPFALDWKENKNERWIVPGLGIYFLHPKEQNWKVDEIIRQIYFSRRIGLDGQAYFRNKFMLENTKGILDELTNHFTPTRQ